MFPVHVAFTRHWCCKDDEAFGEAQRLRQAEEEVRYIRDFPERALVEEAFDLAAIQYGRIDYSLADDQPQIWEINTNPDLLDRSLSDLTGSELGRSFLENVLQAFAALVQDSCVRASPSKAGGDGASA